MDAKVVAALPPIDALPASVRIAADQDQHGQFRALLTAPVRAAEHRALGANARASSAAAKATAPLDGTATATAAAAAAAATATPIAAAAAASPLLPPAQKPDSAASMTPAALAPGAGAPPDHQILPISAAALAAVTPPDTSAQGAAALVAALPAALVAVPPPGATTLPADAGAAPGNTDQTPTAAAGSPSAAASAPASAPMATTLGLRLVAAASNLVTQPLRTPLASLTQPQDKAAAAQPATVGHTALALDMLQGTPKTAADPTANVGTKLLDAAAKDIVAVQVATVEHVGVTATSAEPTAAPAGAGNDALVAQMAATPAAAAPSSAAASPPPALPMMAHGAAEQVAVSLRQAVKGDVDHIQIQLQPAELGAIAIKLNVNHDGRVTVVVSADRSDTLNLLQHDASKLAQALRDAGLQADNSSLSFNLRGFQMNHQATQGGSSWRDGTSGGGDDLGAAASLTPMLRRHSGALDIHV